MDIQERLAEASRLLKEREFNGAIAALENLQADIRRIDGQLDAMGDLQAAYDQAIKDKESYLLVKFVGHITLSARFNLNRKVKERIIYAEKIFVDPGNGFTGF